MYSNIFTLFGLFFLSSLLLGNGLGLYSNPVAAQKENEAKVNANIEQENKCKKDTECENENELNNKLSIKKIKIIGNESGKQEVITNLDLAVANLGSNTVSILLGNGDGTFGANTDFDTGTHPQFVAVGDFDNN